MKLARSQAFRASHTHTNIQWILRACSRTILSPESTTLPPCFPSFFSFIFKSPKPRRFNRQNKLAQQPAALLLQFRASCLVKWMELTFVCIDYYFPGKYLKLMQPDWKFRNRCSRFRLWRIATMRLIIYAKHSSNVKTKIIRPVED